jgi:glycosyltransferase involved in cell wall biosynthesis
MFQKHGNILKRNYEKSKKIKFPMRIIFIIPFSPKYADAPKDASPPLYSWVNPKGEMIGIWMEDHAHYFGFNLLKFCPFLNFEVWRPDYRAKKVYEHTFENGLVHRSFPSTRTMIPNGLTRKNREYAQMMETYLDKIISSGERQTLLMVPASGTAFSIRFFKKYHKKIPMLGYNFISNNSLFKVIPKTRNPVKMLHYKLIEYQHERHFSYIKNLSVPHWDRIEELRNKFGCNVRFNQLGMYNDFWKPDITKEEARKALKLGPEKIILFSSRLVPEYQIDKVLDVISLFREYQFLCIFTSFGPKNYQNLLDQKISDLLIEKHVLFTGWIDDEKLKQYYAASDVFCSTCIQQAGPGSTFFAMLMEKPVMSTDAGLATELLKKHDCGLIFPPTDYSKWEEAFASVIKNDPIIIRTIDREIVLELINWESRVKDWMETFDAVIGSFR